MSFIAVLRSGRIKNARPVLAVPCPDRPFSRPMTKKWWGYGADPLAGTSAIGYRALAAFTNKAI